MAEPEKLFLAFFFIVESVKCPIPIHNSFLTSSLCIREQQVVQILVVSLTLRTVGQIRVLQLLKLGERAQYILMILKSSWRPTWWKGHATGFVPESHAQFPMVLKSLRLFPSPVSIHLSHCLQMCPGCHCQKDCPFQIVKFNHLVQLCHRQHRSGGEGGNAHQS